MIRITQQRSKCIGCFACVEAHASRWRMSRKDGKSVLLGAEQKKEIHFVIVGDDEYEANLKAANNCPVNIINVQHT